MRLLAFRAGPGRRWIDKEVFGVDLRCYDAVFRNSPRSSRNWSWIVQAEIWKGLIERPRSFLGVVLRDQWADMVQDVSGADVMVQSVDQPWIGTIYSGESALHPSPILLIVMRYVD
jgi:hypothetical protein